MALIPMENDEGEMQGEIVPCTKGVNIGDFTFTCVKYGKIIVLSYYFTTTGGVTKDSVIATLDMSTNFVRTFFNGSTIRMHINEKTIRCDRAFSGPGSDMGQIVGIVY